MNKELEKVFESAHKALDEMAEDPEKQEAFWKRANERAEKRQRASVEANNEYHVIGGASDIIDEIMAEREEE